MIYFDNASTTPVHTEVADFMYKALTEVYANPSSLHSLGFSAEKSLTAARRQVAQGMGVNEKNIFFTSGGTEANNTAVIGTATAYKSRGMHIITTVIEHPSVTDSFKYLEQQGFDVTYLPVDENGLIDLDLLESKVNAETTLVSVMYVNNEVGAIQPLDDIIRIVKQKNPECKVHTDCVQALGKHPLPINADIISVSSHKINGPKGVGAIYIKDGVRVESLHFGGGQEKGFRPGTENLTGIMGFGKAVELACHSLDKKAERVQKIKDKLLEITELLPDVYVNGDKNASPYILNLSFAGVRGEVLLHALEAQQIYVATGSACSSKLAKKQKIVDFLTENRGDSAVRFSLSADNTVDEAEQVIDALKKNVPILRKFQPR